LLNHNALRGASEHSEESVMGIRPRTKAAKKRRVRMKQERREKKYLSRVMPMLSRPKKAAAARA